MERLVNGGNTDTSISTASREQTQDLVPSQSAADPEWNREKCAIYLDALTSPLYHPDRLLSAMEISLFVNSTSCRAATTSWKEFINGLPNPNRISGTDISKLMFAHCSLTFDILSETMKNADSDFGSRVIRSIDQHLAAYSRDQCTNNAEIILQTSSSATILPPPPPVAFDRPRGAARHSDAQIGKHLTPQLAAYFSNSPDAHLIQPTPTALFRA